MIIDYDKEIDNKMLRYVTETGLKPVPTDL